MMAHTESAGLGNSKDAGNRFLSLREVIAFE
jgi:hypothetical protein